MSTVTAATATSSPPHVARIVSAAMLMDDGLIVPGVRHYSPDMRSVLRRAYGSGFRLFGRWLKRPYHLRVRQQGFIDSRGTFLSREAAWKVAEANGQIRHEVSVPGTLFSECLY